MKITIEFSDGTVKEIIFTEAQEHALFVDIKNPEEWVENAIYQKARKVIDYYVETQAGISRYADLSTKEEAFLNLNLPKAKDLPEPEYD